MPGTAAKVVITVKQLEALFRSRSESLMMAQRAKIILLAFSGMLNEGIAVEVNLERKQVGLWRRRWRDSWDALKLHQCMEPRKLREAVRETLRAREPQELSRPNRLHKFSSLLAKIPRAIAR